MPHPQHSIRPSLAGGRLSIVIPHHGEARPTLTLVAALQAQTGEVTQELIVVDDASPEPFPDTPGVTVVRREVNGGFGAAVNTGAAVATGDALLILNSDLEIDGRFTTELLTAAEPWWPAVISPRVVDSDGREAWTGRRFPSAGQQAAEWLTPLARGRDSEAWHRLVGHETGARGRSAAVDWVVGAALLLPLGAFREVGGFDERFFMNSEEVDLQRRLRDLDLPSVALHRPTVRHEGGGSSDPALRRRWLVESRLAYADKWGGRRRLQAALTAATGVNLTWNLGRRLAGRDVAPWRTAVEELALVRGPVPR